MSPEIQELLKSILSAIVASGLTLAAVAKFGQSWFFKKLDTKYAMDLAERNNQLKSDLEQKKNDPNKELQIEVTHFKAQLEVLGSQKSKYLEKKVNSILLLNQAHYLAIKEIKELTNVADMWIDEASSYFKYQIEDGKEEALSSYDVYRKLKQERWPSYKKAAETAFSKYSECLALNMPILPKKLVEEDMKIIDKCRNILNDADMAFSRAMYLTEYIIAPEECEGTVKEFMANLIEERDKTVSYKEYMNRLSTQLFDKSLRSGTLIESLLEHQVKG